VNPRGTINPRATLDPRKTAAELPGNCHAENVENVEKNKIAAKKARNKLLLVSIVCLMFMIFEIVGGYLANSLAIMTDAAHMLSDVAGFMISYFAVYLGGRPSTFELSFGYHRAEILGALASILLIWGLIIWLFIEAINRFINMPEVNGEIMLITAAVGLGCNFINIFLLHGCGAHSHTHHDHDGTDSHDHSHDHSRT
jgi:zinc transporter 2